MEKPVRHWTNSRDNESNQTQTHESHDPRRKHVTDGELQSTQQDMDISPGDSTPTSELSYNQHTPSTSGGLGRMLGAVDQTTVPQSGLTPLDNDGANTQGPVLLGQALPRLTSQQPDPQPSPGVMQNTPAMVPPPSTAGATANTPGTCKG